MKTRPGLSIPTRTNRKTEHEMVVGTYDDNERWWLVKIFQGAAVAGGGNGGRNSISITAAGVAMGFAVFAGSI